MSTLPSLPLHVGDYMADTAHLTNEEHGVYLKLLMLSWKRGEPLEHDHKRLATMVGVTPKKWASLWATLSEFFAIEVREGSEKVVSARLESERDKVSRAVEKNRANGRKGGRPKTDAKALENNETPEPNGLSVANPAPNPGANPPPNPNGSQEKGNQNQIHKRKNHHQDPDSTAVRAKTQWGGDDDREAMVERIVAEAWRLAGQDPDRKRVAGFVDDYRLVRGWLEMHRAEDVADAIRAIVASTTEIRDLWRLLAHAVPKRLAEGAGPASTGSTGPGTPLTADDLERSQWEARLKRWWAEGKRSGLWLGTWGPAPEEPGCYAPAGVVLAATGMTLTQLRETSR